MDSFVIKNRPAILNCSVINSDKAYFTCNGEAQAKTGDHVEKDLVDEEGRVVRILSLVIYREQVEEFFDEFRCQCDAWSSRGLASSRPATVAIGCKFGSDLNSSNSRDFLYIITYTGYAHNWRSQ